MKKLITILSLLISTTLFSQTQKSINEICDERGAFPKKGGFKSVEYIINNISDVKNINFYNSLDEIV